MEDSFKVDSHTLNKTYTRNVSILKLHISNLEHEIGIIFKQIQQLQQKSINKNYLLENMSKKTQLSTAKLHSYQNKVQGIWQKTIHHQESQNMRNRIAQKKHALGDWQIIFDKSAVTDTDNTCHSLGITEIEMQNKVGVKAQQLHKLKNDLLASIKELEMQVNNMKEEKLQIEQMIKVVHKRNAAQLLRLKRLINEAQLREQHWSAEVQKVLGRMPYTGS